MALKHEEGMIDTRAAMAADVFQVVSSAYLWYASGTGFAQIDINTKIGGALSTTPLSRSVSWGHIIVSNNVDESATLTIANDNAGITHEIFGKGMHIIPIAFEFKKGDTECLVSLTTVTGDATLQLCNVRLGRG